MIFDRKVLASAMEREHGRFRDHHPISRRLAAESNHLLGGVPMPWMTRWPGEFPITFETAAGASFTDVDGHHYIDFCMGDTGAMVGHALPQVAAALAEQAGHGITTMLPSRDAAWVGEELARRFGLERWQMAMTATDANRFVLRFARHLTGRPRVAVMNWCYHGTVDETFAVLDADGITTPRPGTIGSPVAVGHTTQVVEFNDVHGLERALASGTIAAVLLEPALTNIGIVLPDPGYHEAVRGLCDRYGALLVIDETHTICAGPGGATAAWGLRPDFLVIGKTIGGGMPAAAYGMTAEVADRLAPVLADPSVDTCGVGGTLTGNALAIAAVKATLSTTLREHDFEHMITLANRWADGVQNVIDKFELPWSVNRLGARAEYWFCPPPRSGQAAADAVDSELDSFMHLYALNRGILLTPFHNMALMSPFHTEADVDRHSQVFAEAIEELLG